MAVGIAACAWGSMLSLQSRDGQSTELTAWPRLGAGQIVLSLTLQPKVLGVLRAGVANMSYPGSAGAMDMSTTEA